MNLTEAQNQRGFTKIEFKDSQGVKGKITKSSSTLPAIWLGVSDAKIDAKIMNNGWQEYEIPTDVLLQDKLHLTQKQVKKLLPILKHFAKTGELKLIKKNGKK